MREIPQLDAYTQLHRRLEQHVAPLTAGTTPYEIVASSDALAAALQAARVTAREGDIFGSEAAETFRGTIAHALRAHGFAPEDVAAASGEEMPTDAPLPVVNGRFPWGRGAVREALR